MSEEHVLVANCHRRRARSWLVGSGVVAVLVTGIGWALTTSLASNNQSHEVEQRVCGLEKTFGHFAGRQEEYNKHTAETLKRIDRKVDAIWRSDGDK